MWSMPECFCFIVGEKASKAAVCIAFSCVFIGIGSVKSILRIDIDVQVWQSKVHLFPPSRGMIFYCYSGTQKY